METSGVTLRAIVLMWVIGKTNDLYVRPYWAGKTDSKISHFMKYLHLSLFAHLWQDRKKIETVVQDYETRLAELQRCLRFVSEGIRRLRCHPLLRRNNYYAGDWEVRRSLQTISLVTDPVERAEETVDIAMAALNSVCKGMDKFFTKDSRELRKGCKKEVTMRVRTLAKQLHEGLVELNSIREQLLDATGHV